MWLRNSISIASIWQQSNEHTNKQTNKRYQKLFQSFQFVLNTKHYNFSYILLLPSPFSHKNRFVVKYDIVLQSLCPLFWLEMAARVNILNEWMDRNGQTWRNTNSDNFRKWEPIKSTMVHHISVNLAKINAKHVELFQIIQIAFNLLSWLNTQAMKLS